MNTIFGYQWEDIQAAQQKRGSLGKPVPHASLAEQSARVQADVEKFGIPVDRSVKDALCISLPDDYRLVGDTWIKTAK